MVDQRDNLGPEGGDPWCEPFMMTGGRKEAATRTMQGRTRNESRDACQLHVIDTYCK